MDLGPRWPFWLEFGAAVAGAVLLSRLAVRHARGSRGWRRGLGGLALWAAFVGVGWALQDPLCHVGGRPGVDVPGCDWEYHRAPTEPGELAQFIVLGAVAQFFRLGPPVAVIAFIVGSAFPRSRTPVHETDG